MATTTKALPAVTMAQVISRFGDFVPNLKPVERMRLAAILSEELRAAAAGTSSAAETLAVDKVSNEAMERLHPGFLSLSGHERLAIGNAHMAKLAKAAAAAAKKKGEP